MINRKEGSRGCEKGGGNFLGVDRCDESLCVRFDGHRVPSIKREFYPEDRQARVPVSRGSDELPTITSPPGNYVA